LLRSATHEIEITLKNTAISRNPQWHMKCSTSLANPITSQEEVAMLHAAIAFFVLALIAAFLGFGGLAASAAGISKILFLVFLVLALVSFLMGRRVAV
jgi:uncharacterized membrane protein YtjA (UPF0391 family)